MSPTLGDSPAMRKASLYVFESPLGVVKIGVSTDPFERLKSLLTGHPVSLTVRFRIEMEESLAYKVEACVHGLLKNHRTQGEWFAVSPDKAIEAINIVIDIGRRLSGGDFKSAQKRVDVKDSVAQGDYSVKEKIIEKRREGLSIRGIARELNVSRHTVEYALGMKKSARIRSSGQ